MDDVFKVLAGSELDLARQSASKHLAVLEAANLVTTLRRGREKLHYLNAEPINAIADRWTGRYHRETRTHARRPQTSPGGRPDEHGAIRLHHLRQDHAGAVVAGR